MPSSLPEHRRRRSVLYVPGSNVRALAKAATLPCDAVIIDLEDAVAPEAKTEARMQARAALESGIFAGKEVIVRVNGFPEGESDGSPGGDLLADDLAAILDLGPDGVLIPKIGTRADTSRAAHVLDHHFAPESVKLWLMVETPKAILNIAEIAALAEEPGSRLAALVMGTNDLVKEMRVTPTPSRLVLLNALSMTVMAARAYGLDVLDGVYGDLADHAGFEAECLQGKGLGFDGKTLIHPGQIEPANRLFAPSPAELADALAIIAAFEMPENAGKGVIKVAGRMAERLHYDIARRIVAMRAPV